MMLKMNRRKRKDSFEWLRTRRKVEKENVGLPKVMLSESPSIFFTIENKTDNFEEQVKHVIEDRAHDKMALILRVVPLSQGTCTIRTG